VFDKVKVHVKKHQVIYITGAVAGITYAITRGRYVGLAYGGPNGLKTADTSVTMRSLFAFASPQSIVNVVAREGRGHPGYVIHNVDTDQYFRSQNATAKFLGTTDHVVSRHLRGELPHVKGNRLERVSITI
jgi:hypothetical protein